MHLSKRRCGDDGLRGLRAAPTHHGQPMRGSHSVMESTDESLRYKKSPGSSSCCPEILDSLNQIGIVELLDQDLRPTFIIDLADSESRDNGVLRPVYCNPLLQTSRGLHDLVLGRSSSIDEERMQGEADRVYSEFCSWVFQSVAAQARDASLQSMVFNGICWITSTVRNFRVVSGNNYKLHPETNANAHTPSFLGHRRVEIHNSYTDRGLEIGGLVRLRESLFGTQACWKITKDYPSISQHLQLILDTNWASTTLGAIEMWPLKLVHLCNILMAEPTPSIMFWGRENFLIYNESYVQFLGDKHPAAMGSTAEATFPEIWEHLGGMLDGGRKSSKPIRVDNIPFFLQRKGFLEETYFDSTFLPLVEDDGSVLGFHESVLETTQLVLRRRRDKTLRQLDTCVCQAQSLPEFWREAANAIKGSSLDIPFAILYSSSPRSTLSSPGLFLETQAGLDQDLFASEHGRASLNRLLDMALQSMECSQHASLIKEKRFSKHLLCIKDSGFPRLTKAMDVETVLVSPLPYTNKAESKGLIIIGLSPHIEYETEYKAFVDSVLFKLDGSFLATSIREKECKEMQKREERRLIEKAHLAKELQLRTAEARAHEMRFERLAESAPVGIWVMGTDGKFIFRNAEWFEILRHPRDDNVPYSWINLVHEDDQSKLLEIQRKIAMRREKLSFELKLKRLWDSDDGLHSAKEDSAQHAWILCSSYPNDYFENGSVKSYVGCLTEISQLKWAEGEQARRKEEALRAKQQQEAFVDMVSHEIRNPLAAIIQSADGIIAVAHDSNGTNESLEDMVESAQIIIACAQHQKRIVDDILSMSKLDSDLLHITPVSARPLAIAQQALNMLNSEAKNASVTVSLDPEPSYIELGIDHVYLDPSRLTQVLINLVTNAIKFTRFEPKRHISVKAGASLNKPSLDPSPENLTYIPTKALQQDFVSGADWGQGEILYITFRVQDTGRGLNAEEKKVLFQRFSQANPKTHVDYGGSGLGLFISRTLVEKQGGEIGVASESGVGSIFAFFIMVRRVLSPETRIPNEQTSLESPKNHKTNGNSSRKGRSPSPTRPKTTKRKATDSIHPLKQLNFHILITEDNLINQTVLKKQLLPYGCHISLANHGLEALSFLQTSSFSPDKTHTGNKLDLILMDQEMPQMDGLTCVKRIRELEREGGLVGHVPVIGITANARREQVEVLLEAGMDEVVLKPFRVGELVVRMEEIVAGGKGKGRGGVSEDR